MAFAEHPNLGVIAATDDRARLAGVLLEQHGWRHHPHLNIYTQPPGTSRTDALDRIAATVTALQRAALQAAVEPHLAQSVVDRQTTQPSAPGIPRPQVSAAALARSPIVSTAAGSPTARTVVSDAPAQAAGPRSPLPRPH